MAHSFSPLNSPSASLKSSSRAFHPKVPRAPVQNPYDKFSQDDFDAWIGKLTGDLEKALGYTDVDQSQPEPSSLGSETRIPEEEEDYLDTNSYVEDSFAEVKARRTNKGKARDPREGPGLGPKYGDQEQPIELLSEDEVENQEESRILGSWESEEEGQEGEGEYDEEGQREYDENEQGEYDEEAEYDEYVEKEEKEPESSVRVREGWSQSMHGAVSGSAKKGTATTGFVNREEDYDEEDFEEGHSGEEDEGAQVSRRDSAEKILSDDEPSPHVNNQQQDSGEEYLSDDQTTDLRSSPVQGDQDAGVLEDGHKIQVKQDDDLQPSDEDTSFPPHPSTKAEPVNPLIDIRDPWAQVSKYAEDYYAGGEVSRLPKGPNSAISAHHLGIDDDEDGFLSPDIINNAELASDEDGEQVDEVEEVEEDYDNMVEEKTRGIEYEGIDEHDHLFNRLRSSYFHRPPGASYSHGFAQHLGLSVKSVSGTNEEPIMIESDDEEEELAPFLAIRQHKRYDDKEGEGEEITNSDDGDHHPEEQEDEESSFEVNQGTENRIPEPQQEISKEFLETFDKIPAGAEVNDTPSGAVVQPTISFLDDQTPQMVQQPIAEPPLLPTPPLEPFEPVKAIIIEGMLVQSATRLYDDITHLTPAVNNAPQDVHHENQALSECPGNITRYNLDISTTFPLPDEHDLAGPTSETSFGHLDLGDSISGLLRGLDTADANIDAQAFEFDEMMTPHALDATGKQHPVHTQMEVGMSKSGEGESANSPEEIGIGDKDIDGEEPGEIPFMTDDLESPESEEVGAGEIIQISNSTPFEATVAVQRSAPYEVVEAPERVETGQASEVQILVVEPEDNCPNNFPEDITIEIRAATPIPPLAALPIKGRFEEYSQTQQDIIEGTTEFEEVQEPVSALSTSSSLRKIIMGEDLTAEEPVVLDDEPEGEEFTQGATEGADTIEPVSEADLAITIEDNSGGNLLDFGELLGYTVEEMFTESEYLPSEVPSRAVSLAVINMQVDEVIPPTVMIGDVEESISDSLDQEVENDAEGRVEIEIEITEDADVRNAQWIVQPSDETEPEEISAETVLTEAHTVTGPTLEISEADSYFDQPGTPAMVFTGTGEGITSHASPYGGLPTIIQLPGTPQKVLSPGSTPGPGPTPVAIAVDPAVLKALKKNPALFSPPTQPLPRHSHEGTLSNTSGTTAPTASSAAEATVTQETVTEIPPPPLSETQPAGEPELAELSTANGDVVQTFVPVTTTPVKPTLPILFDEPYPYSLSTPGPPIEEEGVEEEELTEQENSISSSSSAEKSSSSATDEAISSAAVSVEFQYPSAKTTETPESAANTQTEVDAIVSKALELEKGLEEAEAEASMLIGEFLVDEPESDTDADGEADPEFVGLKTGVRDISNKVVVQEVGESVPKFAVDVVAGEIEPVPPKDEGDERKALDENDASMTASVIVPDVPLQEDEDPFKLMGNDSTAAPGEARDPTPTQGMWTIDEADDSRSEAEVAAATMPRLQQSPTNEHSHKTSATFSTDVFLSPRRPDSPPKPASQIPLVSETLPPSGFDVSGDCVGPIPFHLGAFAYILALGATKFADQLNQDTSLLDLSASSVRSLQHQTVHAQPSFPEMNHPDTTTFKSVESQTSAENKRMESILTSPEAKTKEPPRKVHISVEDPYHADNDSDRDEGTGVSGAKKRKRSHSDASNTELPATPTKLASVGRGKGKGTSTGTRSTTKAARFSKNGNKKRDPQSTQFKRNKFPSKTTSRSPSVTSTILSDSSLLTLSSPTHPPFTSSEPRPFLHAHSRRKRGKVPTTVQEQQLQKQRATSLGSRAGVLRAEDVLTKAPSTSSANSSSPITRSHCRYHKISIPKTENGPRINFLVPGCSLNDEDLINEEEIEDHGEAVIQGDTRIVDDIETLDFEAYLHWVMRQLVGPEILRENEVFYLPEPDEEIVRNPHRPEKRKGGKPEKKRSKLVDEATVDSLQISNTRQSPSQGSSVGSSVSVLRKLLGSDGEDLSTVTETEDDRSSASITETKAEPREPGVGTSAKGSSSKGDNGPILSRKRGRRLGQDAAAYHPSTESDESNPDRKASRSRGQKRARTTELSATDGLDGRKLKKSRTQSSPNEAPSENQPLTQLGQVQTDPSQLVPNELEGPFNAV